MSLDLESVGIAVVVGSDFNMRVRHPPAHLKNIHENLRRQS